MIDCSSAIVDVKGVVAEIKTLQEMSSNEHVLRMTGYGSMGEAEIVIITELCQGSLKGWRNGKEDKVVRLTQALKFWIQICKAVAALADTGIIHHDVKCDNVLMRSDEVVVLGDFGEVERIAGEGEARARGTECIQSPEVVEIVERGKAGGGKFDRRRKVISTASDVWQLGCLLWEIVVGDYLFGDWCFPGGWGEFYLNVCKEGAGALPLDKQLDRMRGWRTEGEEELWEGVVRLLRGCLLREGGRRVAAKGLLELATDMLEKSEEDHQN